MTNQLTPIYIYQKKLTPIYIYYVQINEDDFKSKIPKFSVTSSMMRLDFTLPGQGIDHNLYRKNLIQFICLVNNYKTTLNCEEVNLPYAYTYIYIHAYMLHAQ